MRTICCTTPMEGVFGPFIALGRALAAQGHRVAVATGPDLEPRVLENGLEFALAGPSAMEGAIGAISDPWVQAAPPGDRIRFPAKMFGSVLPAAKLPALRALADELRPDLIVHAPVDPTGPLLAAERGLPSVCYGFAQPFDPDVLAAIGDAVVVHWEAAGLAPEPDAGIYRGRYLDPWPASLGGGRPVGAAALAPEPVRPVIPGDPGAPLPGWAAELDPARTVYVSLGTVPLFNGPDKLRPLLDGLAGEGLRVVATVSQLHDPAAFGPQRDGVHLERWLPLAPLLPRCGAVVCHGGTGTTMAALVAGLPLVIAPQGADQFDNAEACRRAGAARVLAPGEVTPAAVRDAVRAVLAEGSAERAGACRVAAEIAAMPTPEELVRGLAVSV